MSKNLELHISVLKDVSNLPSLFHNLLKSILQQVSVDHLVCSFHTHSVEFALRSTRKYCLSMTESEM